jgi:hypothetical protein
MAEGTQPDALFDVQLLHARVHEAELALRVFSSKLPVPLHHGPAIRAPVDHGDPIEDAMSVLAVRLERLDHEPLIGVCSTHFLPAHVSSRPPELMAGNFSKKVG